MTKEQTLAIKKNRLSVLMNNGKNSENSGVVKRLNREIRILEKE